MKMKTILFFKSLKSKQPPKNYPNKIVNNNNKTPLCGAQREIKPS
jgi:hypothetical protein